MSKIKVAVAGCLGRMGQEITKKILSNNKLTFVGGFEHGEHFNLNKQLNMAVQALKILRVYLEERAYFSKNLEFMIGRV